MFRWTSVVMLVLALLVGAGMIALLLLGEAWLIQRLVPMELWQIALVILGVLTLFAYLFGALANAGPSGFVGPPDLDWEEFLEDWEEEAEEDEGDLFVPPPPPPPKQATRPKQATSRRKKR